MALYGEFKKEDWLRSLNLQESDIPTATIIHGEFLHETNLLYWEGTLNHSRAPAWNLRFGTMNNKNIAYANVYGSPMAATVVHPLAICGCERFIQTGYFGGLQADLTYGEVLLVTSAEKDDGVSDKYGPAKTSPALLEAAQAFCEENNIAYRLGSIVTTGSYIYETSPMIERWAAVGHTGVEMEAAATLAIAAQYGREAIAVLSMSDHLPSQHTFYNATEERAELEEQAEENVRRIAKHLATLTRA
ncbi:hypothetical protein [Geomicrobium sp. JCM 19039]|uniref:phosphorylase family protein n=1 Tax=Geomicrobium sp. JCM 19039 TaxID=1460636 RepID=UPI00045F36E2|nr:hypothetical protein [Geomicrobium sp. JCM 19039]GAK10408.1 uridine phosphorylase [Geomicrobium sp. JCM 19039]